MTIDIGIGIARAEAVRQEVQRESVAVQHAGQQLPLRQQRALRPAQARREGSGAVAERAGVCRQQGQQGAAVELSVRGAVGGARVQARGQPVHEAGDEGRGHEAHDEGQAWRGQPFDDGRQHGALIQVQRQQQRAHELPVRQCCSRCVGRHVLAQLKGIEGQGLVQPV